MDRRMPVMSGEVATETIRNLHNGKDVIIVALTASAFTEEQEKIMASGMDDYLSKPYSTFEIYDMLKKHLHLNYIYKQSEENSSKQEQTYTKDELIELFSELESEVINELYNVTLLLDQNAIKNMIKSIKKDNVKLADIIQNMNNNFQHELILNLLESIINEDD